MSSNGTGYEGVVLNQNRTATGSIVPNTALIQEFIPPSDYLRGTNADEQHYPALAGFQLCIGTSTPDTAQISYSLEHDLFESGWQTDLTGVTTGCHASGDKVWMDVYFNAPLEIDEQLANSRFRLVITATNVDHIWYAEPNPLAIPGNARAYQSDGATPLVGSNGGDISFLFRVLALSADEGVDFLGNNYRSMVVMQEAANVTTGDNAVANQYYMSGPQPSKFAVVSLYADISQAGEAQVVDTLLLDPVTTGVYFSIYYSSDGDGVNSDGSPLTPDQWDQKLWSRVPKTFQAVKRDTYAFPEPVHAKYFKVEFSHLQAKAYNPGDLQQPIQYKKFPKWVLDYFMLRIAQPNPQSGRTNVIWNALDLAYNYYLDDIGQEPDQPVAVNSSELSTLGGFITSQNDKSDQVDPQTLQQINLVLRPYEMQPGLRGDFSTLLGEQAAKTVYVSPDYPVEDSSIVSTAPIYDVSNYDRDAVVMDQSMPVMFFYVTCRHSYREMIATLKYNKAYFVGVQEMAFMRQHYTTQSDTPLYAQASGDDTDLEVNDFVNTTGDTWVVYD